jgi:hypothetical protein
MPIAVHIISKTYSVSSFVQITVVCLTFCIHELYRSYQVCLRYYILCDFYEWTFIMQKYICNILLAEIFRILTTDHYTALYGPSENRSSMINFILRAFYSLTRILILGYVGLRI